MLENKSKRVYFIGIGGAGMTPLALLLVKNGYVVGGSDSKKSLNTQKLEHLNILINNTHHKQHIHNYDIIVYSSAIDSSCSELIEARKLNKTTLHRSELLAYFVSKYNSVTITGTHGKTTTSSLLDHILNFKSNRSISILGGTSFSSKDFYDLNQSSFLVAEADESDGSFLNYKPSVAVITNIEEDHLDYYKNYATILEYFKKHLERIKKEGTLVYNHDDEACYQLARGHLGKKLSFGFNKMANIYASNIQESEKGTSFHITAQKTNYLCHSLTLGKHNVLNILASFSAALSLGYNPKEIIKSLAAFKGVKRRLELIYSTDKIKIFDDYAHNPGKIAACLETLKKHFPKFYLITIFQPHRFSRLETMYKSLLQSLNNSDLILICPVFKAGESTEQDFSPQKIAEDVESFCHKRAKAVYNIKEILKNIPFGEHEKIVISTVGAGDVGNMAYEIREHLKCSYSLLNKVS